MYYIIRVRPWPHPSPSALKTLRILSKSSMRLEMLAFVILAGIRTRSEKISFKLILCVINDEMAFNNVSVTTTINAGTRSISIIL
ncbi:hypothetical protein BT96DRAFT_102885 [Gymnopus androsaceus JB14]|uniref:Uncharacterized protein n=1 Tax=Gymnopus androsaceus JB14 TaxID=1447944 RepID=A0A6A4GCK6_9AGAR|nr:hypothetical protein BT96DRAFT_102885 [Gymnopus androsaceus JB14]